jgi:hypothetical protein
MDTNYLDRTLLNLVSIGRESEPARIEKLERMKKEMLDYAARRANEDKTPMSYLYEEFQLPAVAEMLSYISEVSLLQDFKEIDWDDEAQIKAVEDFDSIRMTIALLSYFVVLVNENFTEDDFVHLFADSLTYYQDTCRERMGQLHEDGEGWKDAFSGCLFVRE